MGDEMKDILDEDFDLEKHEELMNKMYGDEYYGEIGDGTEKPVWEDNELLDFDYDEEIQQPESRKERRQREREEKRKKNKKKKKGDEELDVMSEEEIDYSVAEKLAEKDEDLKKLLDERTKLDTKAKGEEF